MYMSVIAIFAIGKSQYNACDDFNHKMLPVTGLPATLTSYPRLSTRQGKTINIPFKNVLDAHRRLPSIMLACVELPQMG